MALVMRKNRWILSKRRQWSHCQISSTLIIGTQLYYKKISFELAYAMKVNEKCGVFSFGVLTLEIIMGKHPGDLISSLSSPTFTTCDILLKDPPSPLYSLFFLPKIYSSKFTIDHHHRRFAKADVDLLEFPLNLEFFEAEFFLYVKNHLQKVDAAIGKKLSPPFNPYYSGVHFLLASYLIPYVGLTGYVGTIPKLKAPHAKEIVSPYGITVGEFTNRFSELRDRLGHQGHKDEGLVVLRKINGNVLAGDADSVAFDRTAEEILRIVYGSGDEKKPGGFYPKGGNGRIARSHLL
ncbi:desiccation-related protein pcc13-62 [Quercus suber]|uniref:Desiccation-related protein pcc13-62 n=1 Tax=Quercus suber TaxID=58331 RepID=A0AAW0JN57_QUESU